MTGLNNLSNQEKIKAYRHLARTDLFFLFWHILNRPDAFNQWLLERCKEVEKEPNGMLDLWAREHYKSSIITFAKTIQDILASHGDNPVRPKELTFGIFSCTRPIAKQFLSQIKRELEGNHLLIELFPDILFENPNRESKRWSDEGIILKRKGNPKEPIDCDEMVLTTKGWKRHGDLIVGDQVFSPNGKPTTIINVTQKWDDLPCYQVIFGNESIIAAKSHQWVASKRFQSRTMRKEKQKAINKYKTYSTKELKNEIDKNKRNLPAVDITKPLCLPDSELPINPYILGVWLGDGASESARFVSSKDDFSHFAKEMENAGHAIHIFKELKNAIYYQIDKRDKNKICRRGHDMDSVGRDSTGRCKACNADRSTPYTVNGLSWRLRRLNLLGNKHVPDIYLMASEKQRMELLQGLMDTDGCCSSKDGHAIFANTNKQLSESVYFLAASLGMKPTIKRRERNYKEQPHIMWWVTFQSYCDYPPFKMPRKIKNCSKVLYHPRRTRRIVSEVKQVKSRPVSCIQVDNEDGLYLVGRALIPTHNCTIEAWGIVEGQPTSKHFDVLIYDDVVTIENVRSPEMILKTTDSWALSLNLGVNGGVSRYIGTRYHYNDTYSTIMKRGVAKPRIHPAVNKKGEPVFLTKENLDKKKQAMGHYVYNSQMMQNPVQEGSQNFKLEWLKYYTYTHHDNMNRYIVVDPANEKKSTSDYTVMMVVGLSNDNNYYVLDMIRDRLSLTQRATKLFDLVRKWKPIHVGYEKYGMQADVTYMSECMDRQNYHFHIVELGGRLSKIDRIKKLVPYFEKFRIYLPDSIHYTTIEGGLIELVRTFIDEEYKTFPFCAHDDMLDDLARIVDEKMETCWPELIEQDEKKDRYMKKSKSNWSQWSA